MALCVAWLQSCGSRLLSHLKSLALAVELCGGLHIVSVQLKLALTADPVCLLYIGSCPVNLLASLRCISRLSLPSSPELVANRASLKISPADALEGPPPGFAPSMLEAANGATTLQLGALLFDQPRLVLLRLKPGAPQVSIELQACGQTIGPASSASASLRSRPSRDRPWATRRWARSRPTCRSSTS